MGSEMCIRDRFMEAQGYDVKENIIYQDNKSTILLLENGKRSSGKRTRAINIRYFFLTDQRNKGNVRFEYCPTGDMTIFVILICDILFRFCFVNA